MSISTFKKDFVNLDSFYDVREKNPLIKSLTNDLLNNGFKDVGPAITKVIISDEDFVRFIDEFIIYNYDTEQEIQTKGAYGIRPWNVLSTHDNIDTPPKTLWSPLGHTTKVEIDDFYMDGFGTWDGTALHSDALLTAGTSIPASPYYNATWSAGSGKQKSLDDDTLQWHTYLSTEFPMNGEDAVGASSIYGLDYLEKWGTSDNQSPDKSIEDWTGPALEDYRGFIWKRMDESGAAESLNLFETVNQIIPPVLVEPSTSSTTWIGQEYYGSNKIFGPNTELFSYLNPHPKSMIVGLSGRGVYRKGDTYIYNTNQNQKNPKAEGAASNVDPGGDFNWNPGYHALGDIGKAVYDNEFQKIKNIICTGHRDVYISPYKHLSRTKKVSRYYERTLNNGEIQHEFYLTGEHDSTFFPPGVLEDVRQISYVQFGIEDIVGQEWGIQIGDVYDLNFILQNLKTSTLSSPDIEYCNITIVTESTDAQDFADKLYTKLLNSTFGNNIGGRFDVSNNDEISYTFDFVAKDPEYKLLGIGTWGQLEEFNIDIDTMDISRVDGMISVILKYEDVNGITYTDDIIEVFIYSSDSITEIRNKLHVNLLLHEFDENNTLNIIDDLTSDSILNFQLNRSLVSMTISDINTISGSTWTPILNGTVTSSYDKGIGGFNDTGPIRYVPIRNSISTVEKVLTLAGGFVNDFSVKHFPTPVTSGSVIAWLGSSTNPSEIYKNGYVPRVRLGPFDIGQDSNDVQVHSYGINGGDRIEFVFSGLVNEDAISPFTDVDGITLNLTFEASNNLTVLETLMAIKNFLLLEEYIYKYMTVTIDGDFLVCSYNYKSSAYMVRSKRAPGNLGLLNIPSEYWNTDLGLNSDTVDSYNQNSNIGSGYTTSGNNNTIYMTGRNYGDLKLGLDFNSIVVSDITNIGLTSTTQSNGSSAYKHPDFSITSSYIPKVGREVDSLFSKVTEVVSAHTNEENQVMISFHYANDLGTFANPPIVSQHIFYSPLQSAERNSSTTYCSYAISYKTSVLQASHAERPTGPDCSFRDIFKGRHPWSTSKTNEDFDDYYMYSGVCYFDKFSAITDHSIGPIVLETDESNPIIGTGDRQPFRIRFDVVSGTEVMDTSQYISPTHRSINLNDQGGSVNKLKRVNNYDYIQVNVATQYQLKGDGSVTNITKYTQDVPKGRLVRPSGYLAEIKPQYEMYSKHQAHVIQPAVRRQKDDIQISDLININSGRVGIRGNSFGSSLGATLKREYIFNMQTNPMNNNIENAPSYKLRTMSDRITITKGILEDDEYKYENSWLIGSSMELLEDAPYNTTYSRMGKGWFKRDGKVDGDVRGQYPMNYHLTILNHGISLYIQDQSASGEDDDFAWFVIQRHVDQSTGEPDWTSDTQPLHCLYMSSKLGTLWSNFKPYFDTSTADVNASILASNVFTSNGEILEDFWIEEMSNPEYNDLDLHLQSRFKRFVVREVDTVKPWDKHVYAGVNSIDSHAVINPLEQIAFNDNGKLIIHFPTKLSNQRVIFGSSELDMISFTDAGAVPEDSYTSSVRYGVDKERFYKGGMSTRPFGNGMRILFLVSGYGVQIEYGFVVD
jgi:hypothetical protein